jgi:hypothetical protein
MRIAFYLPSKGGPAQQKIPADRLAELDTETLKLLLGQPGVGGATVTTGFGVWADPTGNVVTEGVRVLETFVDSGDTTPGWVESFALSVCDDYDQECVMYVVNHDAHFARPVPATLPFDWATPRVHDVAGGYEKGAGV